jgi:multiple sugar transport system permease protein
MMDGAGWWQRFGHVTLPQLRNTTIFVVVSTTILAFKLYTQVAIMTQGGPSNATMTSVYYLVQQGFSNLNVGYGAAIAVIFFLIVLVISIVQRLFIKEERQM